MEYEDNVPDYKGRLFIVGNGPSLREMDLNRLIGENSWGLARIHLIYPHTNWRPTRWWMGDIIIYDHHVPDYLFHVEQGYECWVRADVVQILEGKWKTSASERATVAGLLPVEIPSHVHGWDYCVHHNAGMIEDGRRPKGWHLGYDKEDGVGKYNPDNHTLCKYASTANAMLQQAYLEGYSPIYVIGMDLGFRYREGKPGYDEDIGADLDHFSPDYDKVYHSEPWTKQRNPTHQDFHRMAHEYCKARGVNIFNAGIGGELAAYPRIDWDMPFK